MGRSTLNDDSVELPADLDLATIKGEGNLTIQTNFEKVRAYAPEQEEDTATYKVMINHEEQYSLWPADRENAPAWRDAGKEGSKADCLSFIEDVWTDMRPQSLRSAPCAQRVMLEYALAKLIMELP